LCCCVHIILFLEHKGKTIFLFYQIYFKLFFESDGKVFSWQDVLPNHHLFGPVDNFVGTCQRTPRADHGEFQKLPINLNLSDQPNGLVLPTPANKHIKTPSQNIQSKKYPSIS